MRTDNTNAIGDLLTEEIAAFDAAENQAEDTPKTRFTQIRVIRDSVRVLTCFHKMDKPSCLGEQWMKSAYYPAGWMSLVHVIETEATCQHLLKHLLL